MNISEQKLNDIIGSIVIDFSKKGSISTNKLCDIMENTTRLLHRWTTCTKRWAKQAFRS
ncbi:MAG: hypothetical protein IJX49_05900 [Clostridia bacterium]|nr:hypothetical protein [Clostridia bacterium]